MEITLAKPSERSLLQQKIYGEERPNGVRARAFMKNYPLAGFPEKLVLKIDSEVNVINGVYGNPPQKAEIHAQSDVLALKWGERDGGLAALDYDARLRSRYDTFHTPAFSACHNGRPCAVILPVQMVGIPAKSAELADERAWDRDNPEGKKLVVRKLVSEHFGLAEKLLDAYLAYAKALFDAKIIDQVVAFTRPANMEEWRELHGRFDGVPKNLIMKTYLAASDDRNILLHVEKGALVGRIYLDGCPNDRLAQGVMIMMDYTHQMLNLKV